MIKNIFLSIFELSISGSIAILIFLFFAPILNKRFPAKWSYWIWIFLALWLAIPFYKIFPRQELYEMQTNLTENLPRNQEDVIPDSENAYSQIMVVIPPQLTSPIMQQEQGFHITILDIAAVIWMIGSLSFLCTHVISYLCYRKEILKGGSLITDGPVMQQLRELSYELRINKKIIVMQYSKSGCPMAAGFFCPILVLPDEAYSSEELYYILRHELVHLKYADVYMKLFFVFCNALHWFNPLVWVMCKRAAVDMELACDERVVQNTDFEVRKAYAEILFASLHRQSNRKNVLFTQFYGGKQIMKKRFENILTKGKKKSGIAVFLCAVVCITFLGSLAGCSVKETFVEETLGNAKDAEGKKAAGNEEPLDSQNIAGDAKNADADKTAGNKGKTNAASSSADEEKKESGNEEKTNSASSSTDEEKTESDSERTILAYITGFDADSQSLNCDKVEWVVVPSERSQELGLEEDDYASGFCVYNEDDTVEKMLLSQSCKGTILNWYSSYEPLDVTAAELLNTLEERKDIGSGIPYILTIRGQEIVEVEEHYVP